jgi:hypothetical protein
LKKTVTFLPLSNGKKIFTTGLCFSLPVFTGSRMASEKFASSLKACGVELAHFHGATYAFGGRVFNRCTMIHVHRAGSRGGALCLGV